MKIHFFLLFFLLFIGCSTNRIKSKIKRGQLLPIKIKLNTGYFDILGLPIDSEYSKALHYNLEKKIVMSDTINTIGTISLLWENSIVKLSFETKKKKIEGQFLIPDFTELNYDKVYDPETMMVKELKPYKSFNLIRTGEWIFIENGEKTKETYNIVIHKPIFKK